MAYSLRLSETDSELIKRYATMNNKSISEFIREAVFEKIEDEIDLKAYEKAIKAFRDDPVTYTLDEVERELGLI